MSNKKKTKLSVVLGPYIYKYLMLAITLTCRVKTHGKENVTGLKENNKPWIYSIWHDNVLICPWALRKQNGVVMVSDSKDGEIISRTVELFGNTTVRGSTSKNSTKATRQVLKSLKQGKPLAITPDGPRGPKHKLQDGVLWLAALSGVDIIPLHCECTKQFPFNSWDQQKIPKPFSTIHICIGKPIPVSSDDLENHFEKTKANLEQNMLENVELALKLSGR
jgi:lysophospholipid acyltransferase (LPLAT)-like uncharacterized protein